MYLRREERGGQAREMERRSVAARPVLGWGGAAGAWGLASAHRPGMLFPSQAPLSAALGLREQLRLELRGQRTISSTGKRSPWWNWSLTRCFPNPRLQGSGLFGLGLVGIHSRIPWGRGCGPQRMKLRENSRKPPMDT